MLICAGVCVCVSVLQAAEKTVQDLLTRVPTRGGLREFARALAQRLLPAPLRPEHLRVMLQMDLDPGADLRTPMHRTALELACTVAEVPPPPPPPPIETFIQIDSFQIKQSKKHF